MKEPKRSDYPKGTAGTKAYNKARVEYEAWVKKEEAKTKLNLPPYKLPGIDPEAGINDVQAKSWFKYSGATAKSGTEAKRYYDRFVAILKKAGIPASKWQSVWNDAVDWVGTPGSGATGDPSMYLNVWNPGDYTKSASTASTDKYGTTKAAQTTITEYSTSAAASDLTQAYKSELGFEPGAQDITAYQAAVNKAAKGEPTVYTSTTTTAPGTGGVISTSTSKGVSQTGFDPTRFAVEYARSNPQYAENFAVRNFMKLIDQSLTDPNRIGVVVQ